MAPSRGARGCWAGADPDALDALGWPERARQHFTYWAGRQNVAPIPAKLPPADVKNNLARSESALHSNGDLSNSHYDMNLVYIDALFRHLQWTGDLELARTLWPVIERHLAWERRLFRREFRAGKIAARRGLRRDLGERRSRLSRRRHGARIGL